jgi:hypothetical protein
MTIHWLSRARLMLTVEQRMQPYHRPRSIGCLVEWRSTTRVAMIQHPIAPFPEIVFVSITSREIHPLYIQAVRQLDPGRLELIVDDAIDFSREFLIVRREGRALVGLTPEEITYMDAHMPKIVAVQPRFPVPA